MYLLAKEAAAKTIARRPPHTITRAAHTHIEVGVQKKVDGINTCEIFAKFESH